MKTILASASPRRKELLALIIPDFTIITADADETTDKTLPQDIVRHIAYKKAEAVLPLIDDDSVIISADTLVFSNGKKLGKPANDNHAQAMLKELSGAFHHVYTGFCIMKKNGEYLSSYECTEVEFDHLTDNEIADYIASREHVDKAGSYGIQGLASRFIRGIKGCYFNVVGLPIHKLYSSIKEFTPEIL